MTIPGWEDRDLVVLRAAVEVCENNNGYAEIHHVRTRVKLSEFEIRRSFSALAHENPKLFELGRAVLRRGRCATRSRNDGRVTSTGAEGGESAPVGRVLVPAASGELPPQVEVLAVGLCESVAQSLGLLAELFLEPGDLGGEGEDEVVLAVVVRLRSGGWLVLAAKAFDAVTQAVWV
jgi:hypothetical protein